MILFWLEESQNGMQINQNGSFLIQIAQIKKENQGESTDDEEIEKKLDEIYEQNKNDITKKMDDTMMMSGK